MPMRDDTLDDQPPKPGVDRLAGLFSWRRHWSQ